jgi:CRISPR-associated protein Csb1
MTSPASDTLVQHLRDLIADPQAAGISIDSIFRSTTETVTPPAGTLTETVNNKRVINLGALFTLPDGRKAVTIDSWGSQANLFEKGLKNNSELLGFPLISLVDGDTGSVYGTSLDWSHRHHDATWKLAKQDAEKAGIPVDAIRDAHTEAALPLLRFFPASVLFGWWDSHTDKPLNEKVLKAGIPSESYANLRGTGRSSDQRRSARIMTSEIIAKGVNIRPRFAARVDSLFGAVTFKEFKVAELGIGSIPPQSGPVDVTYDSIEGKTFISLAYLRRFNFDELDADGKVAMILLALAGVLGSEHDLHLRVGADLILESRELTVERHGSSGAPFTLPTLPVVAEALTTISAAFGWSAYTIPVGPVFKKALAVISEKTAADGDGA